MKPYPNYKGNNLTDIIPRKIAFVTEGANKKKFCLFKLKQEGDGSMNKEAALALIKSGKLSEDEQKLVLENVAAGDKAEVQKCIDALKKSANDSVDIEKLADVVADKIVKAIEGKLTSIAKSLEDTTKTLEKMATKTDEDPELSDAEVKALLEAEGK